MAEGPRTDAERAADTARLRDLEGRLAKLNREEGPKPLASHDQAHIAWRMVIELVVGLGLGFGIGFGLDYLFGTKPFLMIIFIFFGFAAGIQTMMRTAAELKQQPDQVSGKDNQAADMAKNDERG